MTRTVRLVLVTAAALAVTAGPAFAQKASMAGKGHDLRATGNTGDLCGACHTSHNAGTNYGALLWNRTTTTAAFTYYNTSVNADFKGGTVDINGGNKISLLCMSCHDGTIALNSVLTTPANTTFKTGSVTGGSLLSTDLSNDHPVAFNYDSSQTALPALYKPASSLTLAKLFADTSGAHRVECASCHDVHGIQPRMLRAANTDSQLCLDCHK